MTWETTLGLFQVPRATAAVGREVTVGPDADAGIRIYAGIARPNTRVYLDDAGEIWAHATAPFWINGAPRTEPTRVAIGDHIGVKPLVDSTPNDCAVVLAPPSEGVVAVAAMTLHLARWVTVAGDRFTIGDDAADVGLGVSGQREVVVRGESDYIVDGAPLAIGADLAIGDFIVRIARPARHVEVTPHRFVLAMTRRDGRSGRTTHVFCKQEVVIGRSFKLADISMDNGNIGRRHSIFFIDPEGALRFRDNHSSNGSWVNGCQVHGAMLFQPGHTLHVGDAAIRVVELPRRMP